ncbi:hypothetical protein FSP39_000480, partial [Pinctada imbricata]
SVNDCKISNPTLISTVYDKFLHAVADKVSFIYMHLGLELGVPLKEIERIRMDNATTIEITKAIFDKWRNSGKQEVTVSSLAKAFHRCGEKKLKWMEDEFDMIDVLHGEDADQTAHTSSVCTLM